MRFFYTLFCFWLVLQPAPARALPAGSLEHGAAAYERKDFTQAFRQWALLARNGNVRAQHNISVLYFYGRGVKENKRNAIAWLARAANKGYARSQHNLGWVHEKGVGVKKNLAKAKKWYGKAAGQNFSPSENRLGVLLFESGDYSQARNYLQRAAARGLAQAQFLLGKIYAKGLGTAVDKRLALRWYRAATHNGSNDAAYALAQIYIAFKHNKPVQIINLLHQAAENGNIAAINSLGAVLAEGDIVSRDEDAAVSLFTTAAMAGYSESAINLAKLSWNDWEYEDAYFWTLVAEWLGATHLEEYKLRYGAKLDEEEKELARARAQTWVIKKKPTP